MKKCKIFFRILFDKSIIGGLLIAGLIAASEAVASPEVLIQPRLECIQDNSDGTFTAHIGYENYSTAVVEISVGDNNMFSSDPISRGQPEKFLPGRQYGAFKLTFDGSETSWSVTSGRIGQEPGTSVMTISGSMASQFPCKIIPITECVVRHYYYYNYEGYSHYKLRAYFGYYNPFDQPVEIPVEESVNYVHSNYGTESIVENDGPPVIFQPGRVHGAFTVVVDYPYYWNSDYGIYWQLQDAQENTQTVYATWNSTPECRVYPKAGCIRDGCEIAGERGDRTAVFGYENKELFTVKHSKNDAYNDLYPRNGCEWNNNNGTGFDRDGNACNYPQSEIFEPGEHENVFSACFDSKSNYQDEGGLISLRWRLGHGWNDDWYNHNASLGIASNYCNRPPVCDAGSSYKAKCSAEVTNLFLNGHSTYDPDRTGLTYLWQTDCQQVELTGEDTLNPVMSWIVPGTSNAQSCNVTLSVSEKEGDEMFSSSCSASIELAECDLNSLLSAKGVTCSSSDLSPVVSGLISDTKQLRRFAQHWVSDAQNKIGSRDNIHPAKFNLAINRLNNESLAALYSLPTVALSSCTGNTDCKLVSHITTRQVVQRNTKRLTNITKALARKFARNGFSAENRRINNSLKRLAIKREKLIEQIPSESLKCS